jgi:hypothetical protein
MARVRGSWMMNLVPTPGTVSTSTRPLRRSIDLSTTSRPTPRPETSVIDSRVENPCEKMSCTTSRSESPSSALIRPRSIALLRTVPASIPAPSSMIVMSTWLDSWVAESRMVPGRRLAVGHALRRGLDPVVHAVADEVDERLPDLVDDGLVDARRLAFQDQLDLLARLAREVAHEPREALEHVADGEHPHVHDRLLELLRHARHLVHGGQEVARGRALVASPPASFAISWSFVRWMMSSPTRFRRWSSCANSTRTTLDLAV